MSSPERSRAPSWTRRKSWGRPSKTRRGLFRCSSGAEYWSEKLRSLAEEISLAGTLQIPGAPVSGRKIQATNHHDGNGFRRRAHKKRGRSSDLVGQPNHCCLKGVSSQV